jgi:hypothetical protein
VTIVPYDNFGGELARQADSPRSLPMELGEDGVYRPIRQLPTPRPVGRPIRPGRPGFSAIGAGIDAVCLARSAFPQAFERFINIGGSLGDPLGFRRIRDNLLERLCGDTPNSEVPYELPFTGGQCEDACYTVTVFYQVRTLTPDCELQPVQSFTGAPLRGPILAGRVRRTPTTLNAVEILCKGFCAGPVLDPPQWVGITAGGGSGACPVGVFVGLTATRNDGGPDDCGDPDLAPVPDTEPSPPSLSLEFPLDIDINNTVDLPINISFNPDIGLSIDIGDINVDFDGIDLDINLPGGSDGGDGLPPPLRPPGGGGGAGQRPPPDDTGTDPSDPPPPPPSNDDPATEEPPEEPEQVIRAVLVTVSDVGPKQGILFQEDNPDIGIPNFGHVNFRCRAADGNSGWTPDQTVKNRRCFIPCPWDGGAFAVAGTPQPGVVWTLTPVFDLSSIPVP